MPVAITNTGMMMVLDWINDSLDSDYGLAEATPVIDLVAFRLPHVYSLPDILLSLFV